jgi:ketosteroid isomerase-like protein
MRQTTRFLTAAILAAVALGSISAQGAALATGRQDRSGGSRAEALYMAYISASVDTVLKSWERSAKAHDAEALAGLYSSDAILVLSSGRLVRGRGSVRDAYERLLVRMRGSRVNIVQIVASAEVASVVAELDCEIKLRSGGWYHHVVPMLFTVKGDDRGRFHITVQSGGDLQMLAAARQGHRGDSRTGDSLDVVLTDASGHGVPGVLVSFQVEQGPATVHPAVAVTDADGRAVSHLEAGDGSQPSVVRASAATLLEEPVFLSSGTDGADAAPAEGTPPPPER